MSVNSVSDCFMKAADAAHLRLAATDPDRKTVNVVFAIEDADDDAELHCLAFVVLPKDSTKRESTAIVSRLLGQLQETIDEAIPVATKRVKQAKNGWSAHQAGRLRG